jgi:hypothetical protein
MRELFTDEEWETLLFAPFFANRATAMTDDEVVDAFESKAMVETVASNMMYSEDELTREVCHTIAHDIDATTSRLGEVWETVTAADVITAAGRLADRVAAPGYKQLIVDVCEATANASDPLAGPNPLARDSKLGSVKIVRELLDLPE